MLQARALTCGSAATVRVEKYRQYERYTDELSSFCCAYYFFAALSWTLVLVQTCSSCPMTHWTLSYCHDGVGRLHGISCQLRVSDSFGGSHPRPLTLSAASSHPTMRLRPAGYQPANPSAPPERSDFPAVRSHLGGNVSSLLRSEGFSEAEFRTPCTTDSKLGHSRKGVCSSNVTARKTRNISLLTTSPVPFNSKFLHRLA